MNLSTRITEKLPFLEVLGSPVFSSRGVSRLGCVHLKQPSLRTFSGVRAKTVASFDSCDGALKDGTGVVLPSAKEFAEQAIQSIKSGKVIAVPTDTLYGFACDACSREAVNRIYEIKGRKLTSPLAICVGDVSEINRFAFTNHLPDTLLDALLPGPVTLVLRRGEASILEKSLNPGIDSIGVRVPDSDFIRIIARGSGSALALTSANLTGHRSSVCIKDFESLWGHCAYVYDGGELPMGRAGSTIVDLTSPGKYKIIRPGSAREETIEILKKHFLVEEKTDNS
ncbi:yrdC domain-containing protein, mitochondrial-like [Chenopodium quinoa]|uniref:Threonylcarbamoyl-AMP synthase n=1 Tax=Chenopodium quinoa TaxID=63459 RepID=A0A803KQS3_CHEQI|nr:yrdC domain-containing protein, mitochondrial-like [Chenopodium quinoa]